MSFGFSVGDFLAVGKLVVDIVSSLKASGGSQDEYRVLVHELECLQSALDHLDELTKAGEYQQLDSIRSAALSCRRPLEEFLAKIQKYDRSLGGGEPRQNGICGAIHKVKFSLGHSDDIRKLQAYLSVHVGTINILLIEHGLERFKLAADKSRVDQFQIKERLDNTSDTLSRVQTSIASQALAVSQNISLVERIFKFLSDEVKGSLHSLVETVGTIRISTKQVYAIIVDIRSLIVSKPDVRWTFFQDPFIVEDALGRKFPVPSEYDYPLLDAIIKHKFQHGPGARQVASGDYEIMNAQDRLRVLSEDSWIRPGSSLMMAVLVEKAPLLVLNDICCPLPQCQSSETRELLSGGRQWQVHFPCSSGDFVSNMISCKCNVWFHQSEKKSNMLSSHWCDTISQEKTPFDDDFSTFSFKNVKLAATETLARKPASRTISESNGLPRYVGYGSQPWGSSSVRFGHRRRGSYMMMPIPPGFQPLDE